MFPKKNSFYRIGFFSCVLCLLSGCFDAKKKKSRQKDVSIASAFDAMQAKHTDLPIPLNIKVCEDKCFYDELSSSLQLCYEYHSSLSELKKYYREQMEYHGWQELGSIDGIETIMSFNKPDGKVCFISLRPYKNSMSHMQVFMHSQWAVAT